MRIALIEAFYDYNMSYLDEWRNAWTENSGSVISINLLKSRDIKTLEKSIPELDLIVMLHTVNGDSNQWLPRVIPALQRRKCKLVTHVGNEFSSPWLSMETRLDHLRQIAPDIIATQISLKSAEWLYRSSNAKVVFAPHGMPTLDSISVKNQRNIDLGLRGFKYPWFLLDDERNNTIDEVLNVSRNLGFKVDSSSTKRFGRDEWFEFLSRTKITTSTEAGSKYVFDTDEVWQPALRAIAKEAGITRQLESDAVGMKFARQLPAPLKLKLRKFARVLNIEQGAVAEIDENLAARLYSMTKFEEYPSVDGKALSSRHLDSIATGTWQILRPGEYGGILIPGSHYSLWDKNNGESILNDARNAFHDGRAEKARSSLQGGNSYSSRVQDILKHLIF